MQLSIFNNNSDKTPKGNETAHTLLPIEAYDKIIIAFSGGKDSLACLLHLIDQGATLDQLEIWHHDIDGREGSTLMDWACTRDYCKKVAEAFNIPIYYSWKQGGFERELLKDGVPTAPTLFEKPDGTIGQIGGKGTPGRRKIFPQVTANLKQRWCSNYLKIDVCAAAIRNQKRFENINTLVVTGERGEESSARSKYNEAEIHRADLRNGTRRQPRHVDAWRPVLHWKEEEVWAIIERYKVNPHPAYHLGWGRVSCAACIFGSANQFASLFEINPDQVNKIADYEEQFGKTIKRKDSVKDLIEKGTPYQTMKPTDIAAALEHEYSQPVIVETWELPAGAYGESCGPK